jgi:restriction endonuclease S subunit
LLEGLEIVELNSNDFRFDNFDFRLDSEYFKKSNLELLEKLNITGYKKIGEFSYVTDGIHTSIDYSETSNINLISATSPRENFFDVSRKAFISELAHKNNPRTAIQENDIILSTVGTIGNCAVATKSILPANSDRHVGIIRCSDEFLPNYVSTFLLSKYGRFQTWRESTGNVQLNLFIYKIRTLKIADLSNSFQGTIDNLIKEGHSKRQKSIEIYLTSETLLLETLGLNIFEPCKDVVNVKSFKESFLSSGRLDAEYYQKKYEEITVRIKSHKYDQLGNLVNIKKSIEPGSDAYQEEGVPFIRVSNLNKMGLSEPDIHLDGVKYKDVVKPRKDTILLSKDGSVGIAYKVTEDMNAITSGAILHLSVKTDEVLPDYLTLILNSKVVQMQAERDAGGSILQHWKPSEIEQVEIPIIDKQTQEKIASLVSESFTLKKQSEQLLETAKRVVEIAIEEGEEMAMRYIDDSKRLN